MMKSTGLELDASIPDKGSQTVIPGVYPAHITNLKTHEYNGSYVFNTSVRIADEATKMNIEGNDVGWMSGREYVSKGVWLNPNPAEGQEWRNKRYLEWFTNCGVDFESANTDGSIKVGQVEENDVLGKPVFARLGKATYTDREGTEKQKIEVSAVLPWEDGKPLSEDELSSDDVPF
jgi:hypothetical protein